MVVSASNVSVGGGELGVDVDGWVREITAQVPCSCFERILDKDMSKQMRH